MNTEASSDLAFLGRVGVIGAGAVGGALARALAAHGAPVVAVASRHAERARALTATLPGSPRATTPEAVVEASELVFLAVPDDLITPVADALPWRSGQTAVHLSGARGIDALALPAARGARVAAAHPLMTFTRGERTTGTSNGERFAGCAWALEAGDDGTRTLLERMVAALQGTAISLAARDRIPYHISGVLASNYVVALLGAAARLWASFGVSEDEALRSLLPLLQATVEKLAAEGLPSALTGPIARGDTGTVAAHLSWLDDAASDDPNLAALRDAYRAIATLAIPIAEAKATISAESAARLRTLLEHD